CCGLGEFVPLVEGFRSPKEAVDFLRTRQLFREDFLDYLRRFRFSGEVRAMPEGTLAFPDEPLLEVRAPLLEAQLLETLAINSIHFCTLMASKASRVVQAAQGRPIVDFGSRRLHGLAAANLAARSFYSAGIAATSNVAAGKRYGMPLSGTMAHSYVEAHLHEREAFEDFLESFPEATLLVDTYDSLEAVRKVVALAR